MKESLPAYIKRPLEEVLEHYVSAGHLPETVAPLFYEWVERAYSEGYDDGADTGYKNGLVDGRRGVGTGENY